MKKILQISKLGIWFYRTSIKEKDCLCSWLKAVEGKKFWSGWPRNQD